MCASHGRYLLAVVEVALFSQSPSKQEDFERDPVECVFNRVLSNLQNFGTVAQFAGTIIAVLAVGVGFFAANSYNDGAVPVDFQVLKRRGSHNCCNMRFPPTMAYVFGTFWYHLCPQAHHNSVFISLCCSSSSNCCFPVAWNLDVVWNNGALSLWSFFPLHSCHQRIR